jgi:hypothetical protein
LLSSSLPLAHPYGIWFEKKISLQFSAHKPQRGGLLVELFYLNFQKPCMGDLSFTSRSSLRDFICSMISVLPYVHPYGILLGREPLDYRKRIFAGFVLGKKVPFQCLAQKPRWGELLVDK